MLRLKWGGEGKSYYKISNIIHLVRTSLAFFHILGSGKNIFLSHLFEQMMSHEEARTIQIPIYV